MSILKKSRTHNSIRNSVVAIIMYLINLLLQFISRKVFIDYLGENILGLNSTITSILQFLNIAELGIAGAISFTLYQPINKGNESEICDIISLQGHLYRKIGYFILFCGLVLGFFIPTIFSKTNLPLWYSYATFYVLLFSTILTYFVTYKQVILSASQQESKILLSYKSWQLIKVIVQILSVRYLEVGYLLWLGVEVLFNVVSCLSLNTTVYKSFPFLKESPLTFKQLQLKYPVVKEKISQLFFHKIATFAVLQFSPIIIYAYTSLPIVVRYGNYTLVISGITALLAAVFNGLNAGVGNLVAEGNKERVLSIFRELFSSRFWIVSSCSICIYYLSSSFISIWVGSDFVLDKKIVLFMTLIFYLNTMRTIVDSYIQAYGLFQDVWAPIAEAILNIGLSILIGKYFGLLGILIGVTISLSIMVFVWKPLLLFYRGFQHNIAYYVKLYLKHIIIFVVTISVVSYIIPFFYLDHTKNLLEFCIKAFGLFIISLFTTGLCLYAAEDGMRRFVKRIILVINQLLGRQLKSH